MESSETYRFGSWLVEPVRNRLSGGGDERRLEPLSMDILVHLLRHPGQVISTESLLDVGWPDRVVETNAVARVINDLRRALGDDSRNPRYIETIRKRGYRTLAPVVVVPSSTRPAATPDTPPPEGGGTAPPLGADRSRSRRYAHATLGAFGASLAVWLLLASLWDDPFSNQQASIDPASVALLPVSNLSGQPRLDQIAASLTEDLAGAVPLRGRPEVSVATQLAADTDVAEIRRQFRVSYVVDSTLRAAGEELVLTVRLTRTSDGRQVWAGRYAETDAGLTRGRAKTIGLVGHNLRFRVLRDADDEYYRHMGFEPSAVEQYLTGWRRYRDMRVSNEGSWDLIIDNYHKAVEIDPSFPMPYVLLANAYRSRAGVDMPIVEGRRLAYAQLERFFGLDWDRTVGLLQLGELALHHDLDYEIALAALDECLALDPDYSWCRYFRARASAVMGDREGARRALTAAELGEYTAETHIFWLLAGQLWFALHDLEGAALAFDRAVRYAEHPLHEARALRHLAWVEIARDDADRAADVTKRAWALSGRSEPHVYAFLHELLGEQRRAAELLAHWDQQLEGPGNQPSASPLEPALYNYLALGDASGIFRVLDTVVTLREERMVPLIRIAWYLDPLRDDPRFVELIARIEALERAAPDNRYPGVETWLAPAAADI